MWIIIYKEKGECSGTPEVANHQVQPLQNATFILTQVGEENQGEIHENEKVQYPQAECHVPNRPFVRNA